MYFRDVVKDPSILDEYLFSELVTLTCSNCNSNYKSPKKVIHGYLKTSRTNSFCSLVCYKLFKYKQYKIETTCRQCNTAITRRKIELVKYKNLFCSSSCSATYHNTHKVAGIRRSKLEVWLEKQLSTIYGDLEIRYNKKTAINSELDIYIPSIKLAFELNGILHYEPIYGEYKLKSIQDNDKRKFQDCLENGIELCIVNVSKMANFNEYKGIAILKSLTDKINIKL